MGIDHPSQRYRYAGGRACEAVVLDAVGKLSDTHETCISFKVDGVTLERDGDQGCGDEV